MYIIRHKTKRGGSGIFITKDLEAVKRKVISLFKQRLEATIYEDEIEIGRVWKDNSQRKGWNYSLYIIKNYLFIIYHNG